MKRPSFQFYPGDWMRDSALRSCSVGARGLWMDMLCLMHEGTPYGHLKVNHKVIHAANLARMVGASLDEAEGWLGELEAAGVFSRDAEGCIFSRRMIRDESIREARASGGKLGGNPALKVKAKVPDKDNLPANLPPTPSSSSSSSSAENTIPPAAAGGQVESPDLLPAAGSPVVTVVPGPAPRARNLLIDALATVGGGDPTQVPSGRWSAIQKCLREIKGVCPDVTVEEIARRCGNYRAHFRDAVLTPEAITKHWATCDAPPRGQVAPYPVPPGMSPNDPILAARRAF